jgi:predicted nucleic acid-binding protein
MRVVVDATPLYNLGMVGETDLLGSLTGELVIPPAVHDEVDVEPARTNLDSLIDEAEVDTGPPPGAHLEDAARLLAVDPETVDAALIASVLAEREAADGTPVCGFVSDDSRLRRLADGLGAAVASSFAIVVRTALVDKYFTSSQAKRVLRRMDGHGLVTTGPLRAQAVGDVGSEA